MKQKGLSPNTLTFACILKACGSIGAFEKGEEVHGDIVREGLLGQAGVLGSALVDMYVKFGAVAKTQEVLVKDVVAWTALIGGYCQHGETEQALKSFDQMKREGFSPDTVTFACILCSACGSTGAAEKSIEVHAEIAREGILKAYKSTGAAEKCIEGHAEIAREGLLGKVSVLGNALVDMYAKCGALVRAQEAVASLYIPDEVSWTALIAGYCQHGHGEEALCHFEQMRREGFALDAVTFACTLKACGCTGAAEKSQAYYEL